MAQLTIQFVLVDDGAVVALESTPVLSSPTANYGVQRVSDKAKIVEDATELEADGALWAYDFEDTEGEDGEIYRYYVSLTYEGEPYSVPRTTNFVKTSCLVVGRYTDSTQIERKYGIEEIVKWLSAGDNEEPVDYALRMSGFISDAELWLDDELRGTTIDATLEPKIASLAAMKAGVLMYESKGIIDIDPVSGFRTHRLAYVIKDIEREIAKIKGGMVRLESDTRTRTPTVVND